MKSGFIHKLSIFIFVAVVFPLLSYSQSENEKNIVKVRTYFEEVWSKGNLQAVVDFYHPNAKHGENFTIKGFQDGVTFTRAAFPNFKVTINDIFSTGDKVISDVTFTGTHTGSKMFRQEPMSKVVKVPGLDIFTFKDGKCINHQHVADHLDLVMQMGIKLTPTLSETSVTMETETIKKLENDAFAAEFKLDTATIARMMHTKFISVGLNKFSNKQEELDGMHKNISQMKKEGHLVDSFYLDDFKVQFYDNTAIATFFSVTKGKKKGVAFKNRRWRWYDVWVKEKNEWKFVSSQGTPLPEVK